MSEPTRWQRIVTRLTGPCLFGHAKPLMDRVNGVQVFRCPRCMLCRETHQITGPLKIAKRLEPRKLTLRFRKRA